MFCSSVQCSNVEGIVGVVVIMSYTSLVVGTVSFLPRLFRKLFRVAVVLKILLGALAEERFRHETTHRGTTTVYV